MLERPERFNRLLREFLAEQPSAEGAPEPARRDGASEALETSLTPPGS